jgi:hypothetical protein
VNRCCLLAVASALIPCAASYCQTKPAATRPAFIQSNPVLKTTQPPISVDLQNATLAEVAAAFYYATDTPCIAWSPSENDLSRKGDLYRLRWTLSVTNKPFWEVFEALNRQHEIGFVFPRMPHDPNLILVPLRPRGRTCVYAGNFMISLGGAVRAPRPEGPLFLQWVFAADPRVRLASVAVPTLTVIDDRGEKLEVRTEKLGVSEVHLVSLRSTLSEPPTKLGRYITSVKGEMLVGVDGVSKDTVVRFDRTDLKLPMRQ